MVPAVVVRAAVASDVAHAFHERRIGGAAVKMDDAVNAAHGVPLFRLAGRVGGNAMCRKHAAIDRCIVGGATGPSSLLLDKGPAGLPDTLPLFAICQHVVDCFR